MPLLMYSGGQVVLFQSETDSNGGIPPLPVAAVLANKLIPDHYPNRPLDFLLPAELEKSMGKHNPIIIQP